MSSSPVPSAAGQAGPPQVPQLTPEFAAYIEQALHCEIEKVQQQSAQERQAMEEARVAWQQALHAEYEQREQAYRAEIDALRASLQATGASTRQEPARDSEDVLMQSSSLVPLSSLPQHHSGGQAISADATGGASLKRPRGHVAPSPLPKRPKNVVDSPQHRRVKSSSKKPATQVCRVLTSDLPGDLGGLKKALYTHIRILWRLEHHQVPTLPPADVLRAFFVRFSQEHDMLAIASAGPPLVDASVVAVIRRWRCEVRGVAEPQMLAIEDEMLQLIQTSIARFGFTCWCPDLRDTPYSLYNAACRTIAVHTFKQALVGHTYEMFAPNLRYTADTMLILRLYDHFVHHVQRRRFLKEQKNPGSVSLAEEHSIMYKNRMRLAKAREKFAKAHKLPKRYVKILGDAKATSDDEWDNTLQVHVIKRLPFRSEAANTFIRQLDKYWKDTTIMECGRWRQRDRQWLSEARDSACRRLPLGLPLDYFDPEFYNRLLPGLRRKITEQRLAFPADPCDILKAPSFPAEAMSDLDLLNQYGTIVLARYSIPDDDVNEVELDDEDDEYGLDEDDDGMEDVLNDDDIGEQRQAFAQLVDQMKQ
ncbi:hypothetical protein OE88DRAFT_1677285 [Heliocybe sulcata]|uniref:Uncharacterized protein n=1 Tax=Heliocybe sulcata TaxID=5364 RepID=A0A5C3N7F5_9AGAM|nr:hypothetical protein OE88DRAFT_1677285 [Heliocybe sulcata]